MFSIPLWTLTFLGGAIAIGIGFGVQNLISNFISGFINLAESPKFKLVDVPLVIKMEPNHLVANS